jgi:DivIVA domain-containing protein
VPDDASIEAPLSPDEVSDRSFPTAFRGFDPVEVRAFLGRVADELRAAFDREDDLRRALEGAPPAAVGAAVAAADVDLAAAKEEADRIVREARDRVAQLSTAATAEATRVLQEARSEAATITRGKSEEAEASAVRKIADAERDAASIRVRAREDADAIIEAAKERGREMIAEAQAARERMIADLNKRKRASTAQLDQLRAGRDRLLESLRVVRRNLDEITTRLEVVEGGARAPEALSPPAAVPGPGGAGSGAGGSSAEGSNSVRPVRSSRVTLGELPPTTRPAIDAPQARSANAPRAGGVVGVTGAAGSTGAAGAAGAEAEPAGASAASAAPAPAVSPEPAGRSDDRRSSALRILRRHRPQARTEVAKPPPGRDSPGEGVRIIGRTSLPAEPEPEPEPEREAAVQPDPEAVTASAEQVETSTQETALEPASEAEPETPPMSGAEPTVAASTTSVRLGDDIVPNDEVGGPPPTFVAEDVRPRIEDLFARIRADRESAVASARQVLAEAEETIEHTAAAEPAVDVRTNGAVSDADERALQARDAVIVPLVEQLVRRLKRAIQDEQNAALDRLRTARAKPGVEDVLASPELQPAAYRYAALNFLEEAARAAAAAAPFGAVAVGVDDLAMALADDIAGAIRSRIDRVVREAVAEELDVAAMGERVSAVYREWKTQKLERIATHYLVASWSRGTFVATPEGTSLRWIVDDDGPCPDCDDNALAGVTPRGQAFPTGQLHPPAHSGCRCLVVVV